ncbi:MAG: hypothetical protein K5787_04690 [Lentisphaeria bacterium]|nr:hypothetical protein [Lentisphaeria bacterium]
MRDTDELETIVGQLDVYDGLDGQKLIITTAQGDEYLIASKKWIKRLNKYADEEIDIIFEGTVEHDPEEGMDVISIKSFKPAQEVEDDLPTLLSLNEDMKLNKDKSGRKPRKNDDDEIPEIPDDPDAAALWNITEIDDDTGDEDEEPSLDELEDEDIPDDINLDDLEDDIPESKK